MSHAKIPPSSAYIWGAGNGCTGWVTMREHYPDSAPGAAALEGTAAHELARRMLTYARNIPSCDLRDPALRDIFAPKPIEGVHVDDEMYGHALEYAETVREVIAEAGDGAIVGIEERVECPTVHPLSFGTVDAYVYDPTRSRLTILDFKYGRRIVEAVENWQAINYVSGVLAKLWPTADLNAINAGVVIKIVQPRAFHRDGPVRDWHTNGYELAPYFDTLQRNAAAALSDGAQLRSGSHCRYCPARIGCTAAREAGLQLYEVTAQPVPDDPTDAELAQLFELTQRALEQVQYMHDAYETQILAKLRRGESVPGLTIGHTDGREQWTAPDKQVYALGDMLGVELRNVKPLTPNQARKAGANPDTVAALSTRQNGRAVVVKDTRDARAREVFTNVQ